MQQQPPKILATQSPHPHRLRGCRWNLFLVLFGLAMMPVFACGIGLLLYVLLPPPPLDILVLGVDSRGSEGMIARTDSIILLGVNPGQFRVSALSIPRDLFVNVPGYGLQRINTVHVLGEQTAPGQGVALLRESISQEFGINLDRYVRLDFAAFVQLVDAVGGIQIYVERTLVDDAYPTEDGGVISVRFDSGWQYMDGQRALMYARIRHPDDDYHRAARQQEVVMALFGRLALPYNWPAALRVLNQTLDTDLTLMDMIGLAPAIMLNGGRFEPFVINRDYVLGTAEGNAIPDYARIKPWLEGRFD